MQLECVPERNVTPQPLSMSHGKLMVYVRRILPRTDIIKRVE
jgi:hypothetical protein